MLREVEPGSLYYWNEELKNAKYVGKTLGCGCCSSSVEMTREICEEYIKELEERLDFARNILEELP